jgi:hypothetical protein
MKEEFGLWGGRPPGGWCTFQVAKSADGHGYRGSREEAEAGTQLFRKERREAEEKYGPREELLFLYEAVLFDPEREPASDSKLSKPSKTQAAFMRELVRLDDFNSVLWHHPRWKATSWALFDKGWIFHDVMKEKIRLTKTGHVALSRCPAPVGR